MLVDVTHVHFEAVRPLYCVKNLFIFHELFGEHVMQ